MGVLFDSRSYFWVWFWCGSLKNGILYISKIGSGLGFVIGSSLRSKKTRTKSNSLATPDIVEPLFHVFYFPHFPIDVKFLKSHCMIHLTNDCSIILREFFKIAINNFNKLYKGNISLKALQHKLL